MSLVDEFLLRREASPKQRPANVLYVTDLTKPCLRSSYFGIVARKPFGIETLRVFQAGNLLEGYWVSVLEEHPDFRVLATQVPVYHYFGDWEVHGRADVVSQYRKGPFVVHEVKSTKSLYYIRKEGRPKQEHLDQLQFYLVGLGIRRGRVDYLDKSSLLQGGDMIDVSFPVEANPSRFAALVARARELTGALTVGAPPSAVPCWLCDYCLHAQECQEVDTTNQINGSDATEEAL